MTFPESRLLAPPSTVPVERPSAVRFSVVVPVFDAAGLVGEALESLVAQTRPPDEVIVSDDGSTDDLASALTPFRDLLRVVRGENRGTAAARNRALAVATGDFVVGLDADDAFLPGRLAALERAALERPDLDVLATDAILEVDGTAVRRFNESTPFAISDQRLAALNRCFVGWPAIRRTTLAGIGGFDESLRTGEDWDVLIRVILAGGVVGLVDEPLYRYRLRPGGITADRVGALRDRVSLLEGLRSHPGLTPQERDALRASIRAKRLRLRRAEAETAVLEGRGIGRRSLALALAAGAKPRDRPTALGWAVNRHRARRQLREATERLESAAPWSRD
jgi:hypothetical protein